MSATGERKGVRLSRKSRGREKGCSSELDELRVSARRSDCVGLRLVRTIVANFLSVGEATRVADGGGVGLGKREGPEEGVQQQKEEGTLEACFLFVGGERPSRNGD